MEHIDDTQPVPHTVSSLVADLRLLGVTTGSTLLVHSSLSSLGYVTGGAHAVVLALREVLGPGGTLVVPTHSGDLSDPARWQHPPVPEAWWPVIRDAAPAFDPDLTPTREMGVIADTVRRIPGALRSSHPTVSMAAVGPDAARITGEHRLVDGFGDTSPLARLYDDHAQVLLLGVGHGNNTCLHLAEARAGTQPEVEESSPVMVGGTRRWVTYRTVDHDADDFDAIGPVLAEAGLERVGTVGGATARLLPVRPMVDVAEGWFREHRRRADPAGSPGSP